MPFVFKLDCYLSQYISSLPIFSKLLKSVIVQSENCKLSTDFKSFTSLLMFTLNIYADVFIIEDEQDLRGVSNTFIDFYCKNCKNLLIFQQKGVIE